MGWSGWCLTPVSSGLGGVARVREIALIPRGVWDTTVNGLTVPGAGDTDPPRALTPVELARVESLRRVCFLRVGRPTDSPGDPSPAAPALLGPPLPPAGGGSPGGGGSGNRKLKLSAVLDPTLDAEVQVMSSSEVTACYDMTATRRDSETTPRRSRMCPSTSCQRFAKSLPQGRSHLLTLASLVPLGLEGFVGRPSWVTI